jgi:hypothetical protein
MLNNKKLSLHIVPVGFHLARCFRIIDIGTQSSIIEDKVRYQRKIKIYWEVYVKESEHVSLSQLDSQPLIVTKDYTLSWADKSILQIDLQSWRGRPFTLEEQRRFDLKNVLDKWCILNVTHEAKETSDGVYVNILDITPVPNEVRPSRFPDGHNQAQIFQISDPDMKMFDTFSNKLKKQIMDSPEWKSKAHN